MLPAAAISLSGMNAAQTALGASAHNIANANTAGFHRQQVSQTAMSDGGVSTTLTPSPEAGAALETDMVDQLAAKHAFLANLAVFRTSNKMMGALMDTQG